MSWVSTHQPFSVVPECCFLGSGSGGAHKLLHHYRPPIPALLPPCLKGKLHYMAGIPGLREIPGSGLQLPFLGSKHALQFHVESLPIKAYRVISKSHSPETQHCWEACWKDSESFESLSKTYFFPPWNKRNILWSLNRSQVCNASSSVGAPTHMEKTHGTKCQMYDHLVLVFIVFSPRWFYITPLTPI